MAKYPNLIRRGAVYWWRRRTRCGSASIALALSLRTTDLREARRRAARLGAVFERLTHRWGEGGAVFDAQTVKRVYEAALKQALDDHEADRLMGYHSHPAGPATLRIDQTIFEVLARRRPLPSRADLQSWGWSDAEIDQFNEDLLVFEQRTLSPLDAIVDAHLVSYTPQPGLEHHADEERAALVRTAFAAWADAAAQVRAALPTVEPVLAGRPNVPPAASQTLDATGLLERLVAAIGSVAGQLPPNAIPERWRGLTVQEAMRRYFAESAKGRAWSNDSKRRALDAAWLLDGVTGGRPCYEVEQSHLKRLSDVFDELPLNRGKSGAERSLSLDELLELTKRRLADGTFTCDDVGLKPLTINVRVRDLVRLFKWLKDSEKLPVGDLYWGDLGRPEDAYVDERNKNTPWTEHEARKIFALPMWTGCAKLTKQGRKKAGRLIIHDAAYWVPLLAWYHGLRREEICKLRLDEVVLVHEVPHLSIQPSTEGGVKTARSVRLVPLHREVLRLGFADYVEALKTKGEELLFPELRPGETKRKDGVTASGRPSLVRKRGDVFYDIWWVHMMRLAFPAGAPKDIHSFRHAVADAIVAVEDKVANDLLGHKSGDLRRDRYGSASHLTALREAVERVPIVTEGLGRTPIQLLPPSRRAPRPIRRKSS